jgi:pyruvate formate lyase activating enzyme
MDRLMSTASPEAIAKAAAGNGCKSVAFTYNDPVIFHEYAIDTAQACRELGVRTVAVSAGYVCAAPREEFYAQIDAVNIDLKGFTESFYKRLAAATLADVLETIAYIHQETDVWMELTNLIIPEENDSEAELHEMCAWISENLGPEVPIHFSAFHPDYKMMHRPRTPVATLRRAREIAIEHGLHYAYTGNVHDREGDATLCPGCRRVVIARDWFELNAWHLDAEGRCASCGTAVAGVFDAQPGEWGRRRQAVRIGG